MIQLVTLRVIPLSIDVIKRESLQLVALPSDEPSATRKFGGRRGTVLVGIGVEVNVLGWSLW